MLRAKYFRLCRDPLRSLDTPYPPSSSVGVTFPCRPERSGDTQPKILSSAMSAHRSSLWTWRVCVALRPFSIKTLRCKATRHGGRHLAQAAHIRAQTACEAQWDGGVLAT